MALLVRRNPFRTMMMNSFAPAMRRPMAAADNSRLLAVDVYETDDSYVVEAAVPGMAADALDIALEKNVLTIKGEYGSENEEDNRPNYYLRERYHGAVERHIKFASAVNADAVEAAVENGLLTITVPKAEEVKPRRIEVKAS